MCAEPGLFLNGRGRMTFVGGLHPCACPKAYLTHCLKTDRTQKKCFHVLPFACSQLNRHQFPAALRFRELHLHPSIQWDDRTLLATTNSDQKGAQVMRGQQLSARKQFDVGIRILCAICNMSRSMHRLIPPRQETYRARKVACRGPPEVKRRRRSKRGRRRKGMYL